MSDKFSISRRRLLQAGAALGGAMLLPGVMQAAWAGGSDRPEQTTVRVGFIPLTDCAPLAIAAAKGFDKKYGITTAPSKEASWAAVRDKLVAGELDAAHILYGLLYGLELGIASKPQAMANLMTLNRNGQAITLSSELQEKGVTDLGGLKRLIDRSAPGSYTFAHTFPTGTHAMWLYYWLASAGIDPFNDVRTVVVPPPQMVMNMRIGNMSGFCVGEPWNARAINDRIGFTAATSQISGLSILKGAGRPSRLGGTPPEHRPRAGGGPDGGAALDRRLGGEHPGDGPPARQTRLAQYQRAVPHRPDAWGV